MTFGSVNNLLKARAANQEPTVGMGATELCYTDRHAYTVTAVMSPTRIQVQKDKATRIDTNGMSEVQEYKFEPSTHREPITLSKRKDGSWREVGQNPRSARQFHIGNREEYHDYSH